MKIKDFIWNLFHRNKRKTVNLNYPTQWETLSERQFKDVCDILSIPGIGRERALFLCLCKLAGIVPDDARKYDPKKIKGMQPFRINGEIHLIKAADVAAACKDLEFIFDTIGLTPSPLKNIDPKLFNVSFERFFEADSLILRAGADKQNASKWLKEASKALTNGQKRKLQEWERTGLVIWWNGVKKMLKENYPYVFQESSGFSSKTQNEILHDILACMNDNRPQENEKILKAPVHDVLDSLNRIYHDALQKSHK